MKTCDVAIIGGGIVGLATAYQLLKRFPGTSIILLEKEPEIAMHQTGHNSGVLHSGIYYRPGSLRAENCRDGRLAMVEFCKEQGIPFELCGKVIVAVEESERERLHAIYKRGEANGVVCTIIGRERLKELEPHAAGVEAVHVPEAGIVDFRKVSQRLADLVTEAGNEVLLNARASEVRRESNRVVVVTTQTEVRCKHLITCGGLWADRLIAMSGERPQAPLVPFRGEYYELKPEAEHLCRTLIYPVPDPRFPFLGAHFTRMIRGGVECGPNAVLAFARDGYRKTDLNLRDLSESLTNSGFQKLMFKYWRTGLGEMWRSWNKGAFVRTLQRLVPEIRSEHLVTGHTGVRAQALGRDGSLLDDFVIQHTPRIIHIGNAPSPAATAALNIGKLVVDQITPDELS